MAGSDYTLRIAREDNELLVLDGLGLVRAFIATDPSAQAGGYDSLAGKGDHDRITAADVKTVNKTMRARSSHSSWEPIFDGDQAWLTAIPTDVDIIAADDDTWTRSSAADLVSIAIGACIRPHVGLARATKVLHLKRPLVFPVLDRFVVEMMGVGLPNNPTPEQLVAVAQRVTEALRREGRANLAPLVAIQGALAEETDELPLVRILDIALWLSHPAAGAVGARRQISVKLRR